MTPTTIPTVEGEEELVSVGQLVSLGRPLGAGAGVVKSEGEKKDTDTGEFTNNSSSIQKIKKAS